MSHGSLQDHEAIDFIDELARVIHDPDDAVVLLRRARFPMNVVPEFKNPLAFWTKVVEAMRNGVTSDGVGLLIEQAAKLYPGSPTFARLNEGPQFAQVAALLEGCDPAMLDALEAVSTAYVLAIENAGHARGDRILFARDANPEQGWPAAFFVVAYAGSKVVGGSDDAPPPAKLRRVLKRLERHELGESFGGYGTVPPPQRMLGPEHSLHHFTHDDDPAMTDLHRHIRARLGR